MIRRGIRRRGVWSDWRLFLGVFIVLGGCGPDPKDQGIVNDNSELVSRLFEQVYDRPDSVLGLINSESFSDSLTPAQNGYIAAKALIHLNRNNEALEELNKVLQDASNSDSVSRLVIKTKSIIQYEVGDFDAFIKTTKGLALIDSINGDIRNFSNDLANVSVGYHELGQFQRALDYQERAYEMGIVSGDSVIIASHKLGMIPVLIEVGELDSAEMLLTERLKAPVVSKYSYLTDLINYGSIFNKRKDYAKSKEIYLDAIEIARELGDSADIALVMNNIAYANYHLGNYRTAFRQLDSVNDMEERIQRISFARNIEELQLKYEDLERDGKLVELELQTAADRNYKIWMSVFALLVISILSTLFWNYRTRLLNMRKLRAEEQRRFQKEKELAALHSSMQALEEERKRVAMDLHDGIGVLASAARLRVSQVNKRLEDQQLSDILGETDDVLQEITSDVRRIARNIMPPTLSKLGLTSAIEELLETANESVDIEFEADLDEIKFEGNDPTPVTIYRIAQELINNALKHSQATSVLFIMKSTESGLELSYKDNGIGLGQSGEEGTGMNAMKSRIESIGGRMEVLASNEGAHIKFFWTHGG